LIGKGKIEISARFCRDPLFAGSVNAVGGGLLSECVKSADQAPRRESSSKKNSRNETFFWEKGGDVRK
jgi:hypothetical protein